MVFLWEWLCLFCFLDLNLSEWPKVHACYLAVYSLAKYIKIQIWKIMTERYAVLRCLDTVFGRPYRCFSIVLKVILSLSDRYKLFTSDWLWTEVCQNAVFSKIDITMTTINKNFAINKIWIRQNSQNSEFGNADFWPVRRLVFSWNFKVLQWINLHESFKTS